MEQRTTTTTGSSRPATEERLEAVYRAEGATMWRALYASTGSRDVADDAVAEAFAQALRRGHAVRDLKPWLWRAAFRIAAGQMSERRRTVPLDDQLAPAATATDLLALLDTLSPASRRAMVLHYYVGLSAPEIAAVLGTSAAAVRVRLHRARVQLRADLGVDS